MAQISQSHFVVNVQNLTDETNELDTITELFIQNKEIFLQICFNAYYFSRFNWHLFNLKRKTGKMNL